MIGGSLESNVSLKDVIQPFACRRRAWLYCEVSVAKTATRILYGDLLYYQQVTPFASNSTIPKNVASLSYPKG